MPGKKRPTLMESAARGAAAGLVGGAVLAVAHRAVLPRLPDRKRPRHPHEPSVAVQLVASVAIGAAYKIAVDQLGRNRQAKKLLDAGLVYAASLLAPELERTRKPRGLRKKLRNKALQRVNAPMLFGRTTTLALKALAR